VTQIGRFSIVYDIVEDRLALDAATTDGGTTRLWITQRLCRGLVKALIPMVETTTRPPPAAGETPRPAPQQAAVQSWEQSVAMAEFGKVPAVRPEPQTIIGLVHTAQIRPVAKGVVVTLEFHPQQGVRTVELSTAALRQTLAVLHRLALAAEWPTDIWPSWIAEAGAAAAPAGQIN
jgi:hypothetical protein